MPLRLHPAQGDPIEIEAESTLVGRDRTAAVRINESSISRKHATIEHRGADWVITDNGSANGTFVDDVQVAEAVLRNGQTLRLGAATFRVEIEIPPSPTQTLRPQDRPQNRDPKTQPGIPRYQPELAQPPKPAAAPAPPVAPPVAPPPPAVPAVLSMNATQAAEILGVVAGALPADVRRQYQRLHNDLQIRMTNTPSPSLKRMYQKNLQELKLACELLAPGASSG